MAFLLDTNELSESRSYHPYMDAEPPECGQNRLPEDCSQECDRRRGGATTSVVQGVQSIYRLAVDTRIFRRLARIA